MRNWYLPLLIAGLILASCTGSEQQVDKLTVVYSGNIGGLIEPCGCNPPLGGFPRRATVIKALREQYENVIVLDSGAMLYGTNVLTPPGDFLKRLNAHVALEATEFIGTDAINVSGFDLANSADSLIAFDKDMTTSWLSANLIWRDSGSLVFEPDRIFVRGDLRIGVFGLMSGTFMGSPLFRADSPLAVINTREAAVSEITKLKKDCDIIIALAYMSEKEARTIAEEVSGINVMVHSHNNVHTPSSDHVKYAPFMVDDTIVVRCPEGGRVVGAIELILIDNDRSFVELQVPQTYDRTVTAEERQSWILDQGSSYMNTFTDLGPEIRDNESMLELIEKIEPIKTAYEDSVYYSN